MASADLYGAVITFLDGDTGDVRTSVNAEQSGLLVAGSVITARAGRSGQRIPRRDPSFPAQVEIVPLSPSPGRDVGIGMQERDVAVDLKFTYRRKDAMQGKNQITTAKDVARALAARYDGVSNVSIPVTGGLGTFRRSRAEITEIDEIPDSSELIRSVVRAVFTFTEAMAANE